MARGHDARARHSRDGPLDAGARRRGGDRARAARLSQREGARAHRARGACLSHPAAACRRVGLRAQAGGLGEARAEQPQHDALSAREREVLLRIAQGFSNKEIAAELALSVKTVETYKARVAEKLDLRSRVDMVRYAARKGWLGTPPEPPE